MADLMAHYPCSPPEKILVIDGVVIMGEKFGVISGKRKNTCPLTYASQSKHKVPFISRIEIGEGNTNHTKSIFWKAFLKFLENLSGINLLLFSVFVDALVNSL